MDTMCSHCGESYKKTKGNQRFCSVECRKSHSTLSKVRNREEHDEAYYQVIAAQLDMTKRCPGCLTLKLMVEFYRFKATNDGFTRLCKSCSRVRAKKDRLQGQYGLSQEEYLALKWRAGNRCGICCATEDEQVLVVDHCHKTGRVRGIVCSPCNSGMGMLKDNPDLLISAAFYLASSAGLDGGSREEAVIRLLSALE